MASQLRKREPTPRTRTRQTFATLHACCNVLPGPPKYPKLMAFVPEVMAFIPKRITFLPKIKGMGHAGHDFGYFVEVPPWRRPQLLLCRYAFLGMGVATSSLCRAQFSTRRCTAGASIITINTVRYPSHSCGVSDTSSMPQNDADNHLCPYMCTSMYPYIHTSIFLYTANRTQGFGVGPLLRQRSCPELRKAKEVSNKAQVQPMPGT